MIFKVYTFQVVQELFHQQYVWNFLGSRNLEGPRLFLDFVTSKIDLMIKEFGVEYPKSKLVRDHEYTTFLPLESETSQLEVSEKYIIHQVESINSEISNTKWRFQSIRSNPPPPQAEKITTRIFYILSRGDPNLYKSSLASWPISAWNGEKETPTLTSHQLFVDLVLLANAFLIRGVVIHIWVTL